MVQFKLPKVVHFKIPLTGKTHTAGAIANSTNRPLVQLEANNLRNSYYGNTEKNVKKLFKSMREIIHNVNPAPVFLLNEADSLIHKRMSNYENSVDATENGIQNIFLEELETFPGCLILTTNLAINLDPAMLRRFHFKLELKMPDKECSEKLWRLHLPNTIPGANDIDCGVLANDYQYTGGQIRIIVQNACFEAMLRGEDSIITQQDIVHYANLEKVGGISKTSKSIGF